MTVERPTRIGAVEEAEAEVAETEEVDESPLAVGATSLAGAVPEETSDPRERLGTGRCGLKPESDCEGNSEDELELVGSTTGADTPPVEPTTLDREVLALSAEAVVVCPAGELDGDEVGWTITEGMPPVDAGDSAEASDVVEDSAP